MSEKFCPKCGDVGEPTVRGSFIITLCLLMLGIIPGLIYEAWRMSEGRSQCRSCGYNGMIPVTSPIARKFLEE